MAPVVKTLDRVAVVVDSAAALPTWAFDDPLLHIVPMQLMIGGRTYLDGQELAPSQFYQLQRNLSDLPTTAAPSPHSYISAFEMAGQQSSSILCLSISRQYSAAHDSALLAVRQAQKTLPNIQVAVLDSGSAAGGEGLIALEVLRAARQGKDLKQVFKLGLQVVQKVSLIAFLDTLYYVWKGGRVPKLAYTGASLLGLKPMFELSSGEIHAIGRPRTRAHATRKLIDTMRKRVGDKPVFVSVMHSDCSRDAEKLRRIVEEEFECLDLFVSEFTPVMGAHTGPGLLGVAFWTQS